MHDPEITAKEAAKVFSCEVSHQSCREVECDLDSGSITRSKHDHVISLMRLMTMDLNCAANTMVHVMRPIHSACFCHAICRCPCIHAYVDAHVY